MDATLFIDPAKFAQIANNAARSQEHAARAIMVLGFTFAPWLRAQGVKPVVTALIGALVGRHAAKRIGQALHSESVRIGAGTLWSQASPRETVAVAGILPVGTRVPLFASLDSMRMGGFKFPLPIFFRAVLPAQPWRFRAKDEAVARFLRPGLATSGGKLPMCGRDFFRRSDGQATVFGLPCREKN